MVLCFVQVKRGDDEGGYDPRDAATKVRLQNHTRYYFIRNQEVA